MFLYGGVDVIRGTLSLGTFVAYMTCQMRFLPPMHALMGLDANLATARVSLRRVSEILDVPVDVEAPASPVRLPSAVVDISFENVSVSFDRGTPVLEQLSFAIRPGEVLATRSRSSRSRSLSGKRAPRSHWPAVLLCPRGLASAPMAMRQEGAPTTAAIARPDPRF